MPTPALISKLPEVGTTIFTVMSSLAAELGAVNLGQGFPDFPMSEKLVALVDQAMRDGYNQYAHMNGLASLRSVLAEKIAGLYGTSVNPDTQITITPGGTYAIYTALTTVPAMRSSSSNPPTTAIYPISRSTAPYRCGSICSSPITG
jgi:methionine transaminase